MVVIVLDNGDVALGTMNAIQGYESRRLLQKPTASSVAYMKLLPPGADPEFVAVV